MEQSVTKMYLTANRKWSIGEIERLWILLHAIRHYSFTIWHQSSVLQRYVNAEWPFTSYPNTKLFSISKLGLYHKMQLCWIFTPFCGNLIFFRFVMTHSKLFQIYFLQTLFQSWHAYLLCIVLSMTAGLPTDYDGTHMLMMNMYLFGVGWVGQTTLICPFKKHKSSRKKLIHHY